ncbi:MAG TPA: FAD-dependent monooxygenase [Rubrobacter sp.]|nr:FAD-dependent monooxygenase [Rubrobacter sp.]
MSRAKRALIIGGGVAGPVAAMALRQAEIDSVVYEAYEGGADDIGAFLTFASNGLDALRTIDANDLVLAEGFPTPRMKIQSGSGKHLGDVPLGGTLPDGTVSQTLKRADLYRALRDEAVRRGARVEYGKRLVGAETTPDRLVARFEDGTEAEGDLLIGADGVHSRTRRLIDPSAPGARYVPVLNIGGYARGVSVPAEPGQFRMVFGKRAFFGYAVHPSGDVWWFSNPPRADEPTGAELAAKGTEQWREMLLDLFAEDATPAVEIIRSTPGELAGWATYDLPSVPTWYRGPMVIIGDAAHATAPSSGQGASLAVEDAVVLARCLRDLPDVGQAFAAYERLRRARVERIVAHGARTSNSKADGPVARVLRDLMMPLILKRVARGESLAWMHDYHIDWDAKVA